MQTTIGGYVFTDNMTVTTNPDQELQARRMVVAYLDFIADHPQATVVFSHRAEPELRGHVTAENDAAIEAQRHILAAGGVPADPPSGHAYQDAIRLAEWIRANSWDAYEANPAIADAWRPPPPAL